jgi:hypothetical protein
VAKKKKKKRKHRAVCPVTVRHVTRVELLIGTKGATAMSWEDESGEQPYQEHGEGEYRAEPALDGEDAAEDPEDPAGEVPAGDAINALEHLARFHEANRDEFLRMAAVQELGPQVREALQILMTLSPEAVATLAEITRLPAEQQRLIRRAVELPDEVTWALRGLLAD